MAKIKSFPNNQDVYIGAEWVMKWLHGRTSGVFGADNNAAVAPVVDSMAVTVSDGIGWMSNENADGIVWWINNEAESGAKLQLTVDIADAVLPRIDRVVVSWQTTNYVALPDVQILKGVPASNPVAPDLTNNNLVRQISLAAVLIPAGSTALSAVNITDERLNTAVCGIVTEQITADTSMINSQYVDASNQLRIAIQQAWNGEISDGSITTEKLSIDFSVSSEHYGVLSASGWSGGAPYTQIITVEGIKNSDVPFVDVNLVDASASEALEIINAWMLVGRIFASADNTITAYCYEEAPTVDIPIILKVVR